MVDKKLDKNPNWKGGRKQQNGYWMVKAPDHPNAQETGYIYEHRLIMSNLINRPLYDDEIVHHIDEDKLNNEPSNLRLERKDAHLTLHHNGSKMFTDEQINAIASRYEDGESSVSLAKKFGCSPNMILYWVRRKGGSVRTPGEYKRGKKGTARLSDDEIKNAYTDYCESKIMVTDIAIKYDMSLAGLVRAFRRMGWPTGKECQRKRVN